MANIHVHSAARRAFLKRAAAVSAMGGAAPLLLNLAAMGEASAAERDYKALVCVFLSGGNDHANTVVPYDPVNHREYVSLRGGLMTAGGIAFPHDALTATALTPAVSQTLTDGLQYALAPALGGLKTRWDANQCAVLLNVGPLLGPTDIQQYTAGAGLPPRLFSHNDQQSVWQSMAAEGSAEGWGGRIGDLAMSGNQSMLTCVSAGGNAVFLAGHDVVQYQIATQGALPIYASQEDSFGGACRVGAYRALIAPTLLTGTNLMENDFIAVTQRSMDLQQVISSALSGVTVNTAFDANNPLARQFGIVARLIAARGALGLTRQVFFVQLGGFDNHTGLVAEHALRMQTLNAALSQFHDAMVELGTTNKVTTFTASDFGRTLSSNGDGSDHGWGSHHFILGGAVQGGRYYGTAPQVSITSPDQVGQGRLLPSTSVDQMAATLARWFGVSSSNLPLVAPHIGSFDNLDLGFMG